MLRSFLKKLGASRPDTPCLYGRFGMTVYDLVDGERKIVRRVQKNNQVVNDGRSIMLELLRPGIPYGVSPIQQENQLWSLGVGDIGTPPLVTDVGLHHELWVEAFLAPECVISAPPVYELQVYKILPALGVPAGTMLREAAIFSRGDDDDPSIAGNRRMYCRQAYPVIETTATMTILYDWRLGITVA